MILDCEQGSKDSDNPEHSAIWYKYYIGDEEGVYGELRYELIPHACILHAYPVKGITKRKLKELREENKRLAKQILVDIWGYEDVYYVTDNEFLVKFFSHNKYKQVNSTNGTPVYLSKLEEVICHK